MAGILERYRQHYDFADDFPIVSLEEGNTPLVPAPRIAEEVCRRSGRKGIRVFLKYEGANPTGSFKDRGMTYAVSQAKAAGHTHIICASTGNTSAAAAAYGARAGLKTLVILPSGKVAMGKLSQAVLYGADIVEIDGNFDQALEIVRQMGDTGKVCVVNSINEYRPQGQKSAAFEVCDTLGEAPDELFIPVGNAGNITAYWLGFKEYSDKGITKKRPRMHGYEAQGAAAIVYGKVVENPETIATAIRIGNPASWETALIAEKESGGQIDYASDEQIIAAYTLLASAEGVLCEPSSATSVAGLLKAAETGYDLKDNSTIVCVLTGNGLKDPDSALAYGKPKRAQLPASFDKVAEFFAL